MAAVSLKGISKGFGNTPVLKHVDLDIVDGEFLALVGPSGCGKSTLLRIIAGLERQDAGSLSIGDNVVDHLRPHERKVAMVFQNYALYPHMTVFENMALPLTMARLNLLERIPFIGALSRRKRRVMEDIMRHVQVVAEQLRIEAFGSRKPSQLSGGQRQRVALGRAMVRDPDVFLMDEPLSNLDAKLRVHMRTELAELHDRLGVTMVYVTHDQVEAMSMADRLAVMDQGTILQLGTPAEVYERPASIVVAQFIGSPGINLIPAAVGPAGLVEMAGLALPLATSLQPGTRITIGVRPEAARLQPLPGDVQIPVKFRRRENLGSESILHFALAGSDGSMLCTVSNDQLSADAGASQTTLAVSASQCHVFDENGWRVTPSRLDDAEAPDKPDAAPPRPLEAAT
ncbi:MAG TPA: ABC transporter ATP-binding protein [Ramlibacter sp.]|nr:ABC transporter ATP-binding protein [Ramlibacter sp.]